MSKDENVKKSGPVGTETDTIEENAVTGGASREEAANGTRKPDEVEVDTLSTLEERVVKLEEENSTLKDQYLRKQADFENFRKRMVREKEDAIKYANSVLLLDIVSIIDDFERAIRSSGESRDFDSFYSGIELIEKQFTGMLERKWGLTRFESEGEPFDPEKHEAIAMEGADTDTQTVLEDYLKGYMLHDRVLRHAKVKVSSPAAPAVSDEAKEDNTKDDTTMDEMKEEKQ